jgi:hypothetical protein
LRTTRLAATVAVAISLLAVSLCGGGVAWAWSVPDSLIDSSKWCGHSLTRDWACGRQGSAFAGTVPLHFPAATRIAPGTQVSTEENASARVSLRNQARCTIGGGETSSEVITRPRDGILLRQQLGDSACATPQHPVWIELCAGGGGDCIPRLRVEGTALARVFSPEVTASLTETIYRRTRIVSCSGQIRLRAGEQVVAGGARGRNRYVLEVIETSSRTESQGTTVTTETADGTTITATSGAGSASSSAISIIEIGELPGRGPCTASFVSEGERTVEG